MKNLYLIFTNVSNRYLILTCLKNQNQILTSVTNWHQIITCEKNDIKTHMTGELAPNPRTCEKLVPNYHRCEEQYFIVTGVIDKTVKN